MSYNGAIKSEQLLELFNARQSERRYDNRAVEREKIERVLEAARLAPSACNAQPWTYVVVDSPELKNSMVDAIADRVLPLNHFTKQAPVIIAVVEESANLTSRVGTAVKGTYFPPFDIGLSLSQLCLQATVEGLGTCIMGWLNQKKVKTLLGIPKGKKVPLVVTLGYPTEAPREKKRKPIGEIARWNGYREKER